MADQESVESERVRDIVREELQLSSSKNRSNGSAIYARTQSLIRSAATAIQSPNSGVNIDQQQEGSTTNRNNGGVVRDGVVTAMA